MINYQIINGNYTFKNKLEKRSVENIILTSLSDHASRIFKDEPRGYLKRSTFVLYSICKHHIPRLTIKTFEKVLSNLIKTRQIYCVFCPDAKKYVYCSPEQFNYSEYFHRTYNESGFFINRWRIDSDYIKLDGILEEDIKRLIS